MSVLITRGSSIKSLVCSRSLGSKGVDVINGDSLNFNPCSYSKFVKYSIKYPSPEEFPELFIESIIKVCNEKNIRVIIPVHSEETIILAKNKQRIEKETNAKLPLAPEPLLSKLNDKSKIFKIANNLGIPTPKTFTPLYPEEIEEIAGKISYPAVIKPRNATSSIGIKYPENKSQLINSFYEVNKKYCSESKLPVVQEYVQGTGYGVSVLYNNGVKKAFFTHKRIREYPLTGGSSSARVSIKNQKLQDAAFNLMDSMGWHGLAMVEFKYNEKKDELFLLEVNPRVWGSIYQAIASGVDFPYLLYNMALNGDIETVNDYKTGIYTRFLLNDARVFFASLFNSCNVRSDFCKDNIAKFNNYYSPVNYLKPKYLCDDFDTKDIMPFIAMAIKKLFFKSN